MTVCFVLCDCLQPLIEVEIERDYRLGLGMGTKESTRGHNNDQRCLIVDGFRSRANGSPGPAEEAGVEIGDILVTANGYAITDFASLKRVTENSIHVTFVLQRKARVKKQPERCHDDGDYPEIVLLNVIRASPTEKMGAKLAEVHEEGCSSDSSDEDGESYIAVKSIWAGPLLRGGLNPDDVLLAIDGYDVTTLKEFKSLVHGKTNMHLVVKRIPQSRNGKGRRDNNFYTFDIAISDKLGLGLNLAGIKSGLEETSSGTFLYVKNLLKHRNGDPGPGILAGVRPYDVLLKINGMKIHSIADAKRAIEGQNTAKCQVRRMTHSRTQHIPR